MKILWIHKADCCLKERNSWKKCAQVRWTGGGTARFGKVDIPALHGIDTCIKMSFPGCFLLLLSARFRKVDALCIEENNHERTQYAQEDC